MLRAALGLLFFATVLGRTSELWANGRFPRAQRLLEDPRDPQHLLLAATYGLLVTRDGGKNWHHVCEGAFAKQASYEGDPLLELSASGAVFAGVDVSLNRSADGACGWSVVLGGTQSEYIPDFTLARDANGQRREIVALHATLAGGRLVTRLQRSRDDAVTFLADAEELALSPALSVDVAPSDANFVYVTGLANGVPTLLVSEDAGSSFRARTIPSPSSSDAPYIAAVHPHAPRTLFVRTDGRMLVDDRVAANDALLLSHDAGVTWSLVHRASANLLGFALSPDGASLLFGYGATGDAVVAVDASVFGAYHTDFSGSAARRVLAGNVTCLTWTARGVYVCSSQQQLGYALGFAPAPAGLDDFLEPVPLLDLSAVRGPICCGGAETALCSASWPSICVSLGACERDPAPTCQSVVEPEQSDVVARGATCAFAWCATPDVRAEALLGVAASMLLTHVRRRRSARNRVNAVAPRSTSG